MASAESRDYELVYIVQPGVDEAGLADLNQRLVQTVESQNGAIRETELWGLRTLAYPIQKHFEGHYVVQHLDMPPDGTTEVERVLRFNEDVIRFLMFRDDE